MKNVHLCTIIYLKPGYRMDYRKFTVLTVAVLASLSLYSCKDDDETETTPSLDGTLSFDIPSFIFKGSTHRMVPSGITHPEGGAIGYYWKVTPDMTVNDTTKFLDGTGKEEYIHTFKDTLCTFSVSGVAFAEGYLTSSATKYVTSVDESINGSLTDAGFTENDKEFFTDPRDGKKYFTCKIGGMEWFRQNLAYLKSIQNPVGMPYSNADAMSNIFGRYYTWEEAMNVCPEGWRLPTEQDWIAMANEISGGNFEPGETLEGLSGSIMVNARFNSNLMWEFWPDVKITNKSGLSVIPVGYATLSGGKVTFSGANKYAIFWTSTDSPADASQAVCRYIYWDQPDVMASTHDKTSFVTPVRCVRDID